MAEIDSHFRPSIDRDHHGPQLIITGGIMLATTILMLCIAVYNRYHAKTLLLPDSPLLLVGVILDVVSFALCAVAVKHGFGEHFDMGNGSEMRNLKKLFLGIIMAFFFSHGVIKISYNILARNTARSSNLKSFLDGFSVLIGLWTLSNAVVIIVSLVKAASPNRIFFWISGIVSIFIITGQLLAFLWIIWKTKAKFKVKFRWSLSIGAFVPLCVVVIILRLVYTPRDYFEGDWTFDDILQAMLFQIELSLVIMTVMAPNLPLFFQKTSTGGVYFLPGEAIGGSRSDSVKRVSTSYAMSSEVRKSLKDSGGVFTGKRPNSQAFSVSGGEDSSYTRNASLDSDVILMQRSIEIERELGLENSEQSHSNST